MVEHPIDMDMLGVHALLQPAGPFGDRMKSQHRVPLDPQPVMLPGVNPDFSGLQACRNAGRTWCLYGSEEASVPFVVPYTAGDLLWVREDHYLTDDGDQEFAVFAADASSVQEHQQRIDQLPASFPADVKAEHLRLRPPEELPRWATRFVLTVTEVRVQRVWALTADDAEAEGLWRGRARKHLFWLNVAACRLFEGRRYDRLFASLWDARHGDGAWQRNDWVAALTFTIDSTISLREANNG